MNPHRHQLSSHAVGGTRKTFLRRHHDNMNKYFQSLTATIALGTLLTKRPLQQLLALAALPVQHCLLCLNVQQPLFVPPTPKSEPCIFSLRSSCLFQPRYPQNKPSISLNHSGASNSIIFRGVTRSSSELP